MAIYELRTYEVAVGNMARVVELYQEEGWPALKKHPELLIDNQNWANFWMIDTQN